MGLPVVMDAESLLRGVAVECDFCHDQCNGIIDKYKSFKEGVPQEFVDALMRLRVRFLRILQFV